MLFDIAPSEFLLTAIVAVVVIGPKDMPRAMRTMGRWMGTVRRVSGHFRSGIETMIREAEMEEMEKKWREQNEAIMKAAPVVHPPAAALEDASLQTHAPTEPLTMQEQAELAVDPYSASAQEATSLSGSLPEAAGHEVPSVAHGAKDQSQPAPTPQQGQ